MTVYSDFAAKKREDSKWLALNIGEAFTGKYLGAEPVKNRFGNLVLNYSFLDDEGRRKELEDGSISLSAQFEEVEKKHGLKTEVTVECSAADKINPKTGTPYKRYQVLVGGKPVVEEDAAPPLNDDDIPVIDEE